MKTIKLLFSATLLTLLFVLLSVISTPKASAWVGSCPDASLWIESTPIVDNSSGKVAFPVDTPFILQVEVRNPDLVGKPVTFSSPNPWLTLVGDGHISDYGVATANTNFKINWPAGNDGHLAATVKILPSDIIAGTNPPRGNLMTIGIQVQGARCNPKIEIYGTR